MKRLWDKLTVPIIQGGMGVGISMGNLAGAVAREGAVGVISTANIGFLEEDFWSDPREAGRRALHREITKAREIAQGKGLICINAMVATSDFGSMVQTAVEAGIDGVISGAGLPLSLPEYTGNKTLAIPIVSSLRAAKVLVKHWQRNFQRTPDAMVVEGCRAGGHLGFSSQDLKQGTCEPLENTVEAICQQFPEIPVFGAGGVFTREDVVALQRRGAFGAQIATRFIATAECDASQGYKDAILAAGEEDVVITQSPVGMPGRALRSPLVQAVEEGRSLPPKQCVNCIVSCNPGTTPYCINQALIAAYHGDWEKGLFFCGDNVGRVREMTTVSEIIKELTV